MTEKEFFNKIMGKIENLNTLQKANRETLDKMNHKLNQLGLIMMLDNVFEDLEEDENV